MRENAGPWGLDVLWFGAPLEHPHGGQAQRCEAWSDLSSKGVFLRFPSACCSPLGVRSYFRGSGEQGEQQQDR